MEIAPDMSSIRPEADKTVGSADGLASFRAKDLTKRYQAGEVRALRGVSLERRAFELVLLLGPSGSGKSTLLNILGGLDIATSGQVFFHDIDLTKADQRQLTRYRRDHVGFVFQFYNPAPSLAARENVALVTEIAKEPVDGSSMIVRTITDERQALLPGRSMAPLNQNCYGISGACVPRSRP